MMRPLFFLFLLSYSALAAPVFTYSDKELLHYEKRYGSGVRHRMDGYLRSVERIKQQSRMDLLNRVNTLVNSYRPEHDTVVNNRLDYWSTPKEFLAAGFGDCEEYAIMKYMTLKHLGFPESSLCLAVVKDGYSGSLHMVLNVYDESASYALVMDNLSFRVLPMHKRIDLKPQYCVNQEGVFGLDMHGKRYKTDKKDQKFEDLIKRIGEGR